MMIAKGSFRTILGIEICTLLVIIAAYLSEGFFKMIFVIGGIFLFLLIVLLFIFFRDPERKIGAGVVAVADGVIREISEINDADVGDCVYISTFLNIHNVHVNRVPLDGTIVDVVYSRGSHIPAFKKTSERNERMTVLLQTSIGLVKIVLIAGTVARRIILYVQKNDYVTKGQRLGLIKFGSRADVFLPRQKISLTVQKKDTIKAGVDTLANITS